MIDIKINEDLRFETDSKKFRRYVMDTTIRQCKESKLSQAETLIILNRELATRELNLANKSNVKYYRGKLVK
jgi:hypothetical protein